MRKKRQPAALFKFCHLSAIVSYRRGEIGGGGDERREVPRDPETLRPAT